MLKIVDVDYIKDYQIVLTFNNGKVKNVDLSDKLKGSLFEPLKDLDLFIQFGLVNGTIEWVNGADFAPEYLFRIGKALNL